MRSRPVRAARAAGVVALAFTLALAVGVLAPTAAHASSMPPGANVTITVGTHAELVNRVFVQVPVTGTCTPPFGASATATVLTMTLTQTVVKASASGTNSINVPCDGVQFTATVDVTPATTAAFHNGFAIAQASTFAGFSDGTSVTVGNGPLTIKIGS